MCTKGETSIGPAVRPITHALDFHSGTFHVVAKAQLEAGRHSYLVLNPLLYLPVSSFIKRTLDICQVN